MAGGGPSSLAFYDFASAPLAKLVGFFLYGTDQSTFGKDLSALVGLVAEGRLVPQVGTPVDWSETVAAVDALRLRRASGKVVLTVDHP